MKRKIWFGLVLSWAIIASLIALSEWKEIKDLKRSLNYFIEKSNDLSERLEYLAKNNTGLFFKAKTKERLVKNLAEQVERLWEENEKLRKLVEELKEENRRLKQELGLYKQIPKGYYSTDVFPDCEPTLENLKKVLSKLKIQYRNGTFDCSEISAYVEWALEDAGFDTYIVVGKCNNAWHAWNLVRVDDSLYYVDDSSGKPYIFKSDPRYKPIKVFDNIYDVVKFYGSVKEWDWWSVLGFPPKL